MSYYDFLYVLKKFEECTRFELFSITIPKELTDKLALKRRTGVVLYRKPMKNDTVEHKEIKLNRFLCTAAYR